MQQRESEMCPACVIVCPAQLGSWGISRTERRFGTKDWSQSGSFPLLVSSCQAWQTIPQAGKQKVKK
ncbi:hypothetical protein NQZ68_038420 [Dissostichus eleginoides]|nr:hypothetical protein NQZ68_038420 [Dissostichus eleginoides]